MNTMTPPQVPAQPEAAATLERFAESFLRTNPFMVNRVLQPATAAADAATVHQAAFRRLVELAETVADQPLGLGVVLWGEAGIGKSHLLARLAGWARDQACFVYFHNLQARAESLPRYVLNCVVSALILGRTRPMYTTPLVFLVNAVLKQALQDRLQPPPTWEQARAAYARWLDHLVARDPVRSALLDRTVFHVLLEFFRSAHNAYWQGVDDGVARLAVQWLSGDPLDADAALALKLRVDAGDPVALRDEQHVKQVLVALAQMLQVRQRPLLLCFDQVDNLEPDQVGALARFLQTLLDSTPNLLVVTAGVQEALLRFHETKVIQGSSWDRLAQFEIALQRISPAEAGQVVQVRLEPFVSRFMELETVKNLVQTDHLFPLGKPWFEEFVQGKAAVRPRDVLTWAREGWRREQEIMRKAGAAAWLADWGKRRPTPPPPPPPINIDDLIDLKVEQKIAEHQSLREREPQTLPPDAGNLAGLGLKLLQQCQTAGVLEVRQLRSGKAGPPPRYDLMVRQRTARGTEKSTGLVFVVTGNANATTAYLRRLVQDPAPPQQVLLVTDERQPLALGAQGQRHLNELSRRSLSAFQHVELSLAQ